MSLMNERYSCRAYDTERPVEHDLLNAVLDAARIAPSACNRQPWQFLVIEDDAAARDIITRSYDRDWIKSAPAYIIAIGDHDAAWHRADGKDHTDVDIAIATEHICLAAASLGLGTCWVCNFDRTTIAEGFDMPSNLEPIVIIPIGYPAKGSIVPAKKRKEASEIIKWGKL